MSEKAQLLKSLLVMASFVEARDPYTAGHQWRVSRFARLLADASEEDPHKQALAELGGYLHDIGKITVPDHILTKPGKLLDAEYEIIKTHPAVGGRMLQRHPLASLVLDAVMGHHEMVSGMGYPQGLEGTQIPWVARVVAIGDAFDAMTSTRPYRKSMPLEKALSVIAMAAGTQFDKDLAKLFVSLGHKGYFDHVIGHSENSMPVETCPRCGPTIHVSSASREGDFTYCRVCGNEARLHWKGEKADLQFTGAIGSPSSLTHHPDMDIIESMVNDLGRYLI